MNILGWGRIIGILGWATATSNTAISAEQQPTADTLLAKAQSQAAAQHKTIYVHFGASWCGWCRKLDAFLDRPEIKPAFENYFIPVKVVVSENEQHKALENSGGDALLRKLGGPEGLPYSAFLDAEGKLIVNSRLDNKQGGNIGYPAKAEEIGWFVTMMKRAAPKMEQADLDVIEKALRKDAE